MTIISCEIKPTDFVAKPYVVFDMKEDRPDIYTKHAQVINFPLSNEDREDIQTLEQQFDHEDNCAGLAAPQIGISKQVIVFATPDDPEIKRFRSDFVQEMPKTLWINPEYEGVEEDGMHEDYEGCFSISEMAGMVSRYNTIQYRAYDINGRLIEGDAKGFLARIIQHEVDHLHGILYIDRMTDPGKIIPIEEYRSLRKAAMESEKSPQ
ncbi:MAG: peptide deformylase [Alphaproteobacteria bacterium]|nr:peptide deformylase [Alphaproteobacteria bacterium]